MLLKGQNIVFGLGLVKSPLQEVEISQRGMLYLLDLKNVKFTGGDFVPFCLDPLLLPLLLHLLWEIWKSKKGAKSLSSKSSS